MKISVLTMFPEFFDSFKTMPLIKRAVEKGAVKIEIVDIKDFSGGSFRHIDDSPFGGGNGMVMRVKPVFDALKATEQASSKAYLLSPKGKVLNQKTIRNMSETEHIILICGHYEGIDARIEKYVHEQISVGDYILSGGESAALVVMDCIIRLLDGVLREGSAEEETHENGLLEYPQYTRPADFDGDKVPQVLLSGNDKKIREWRYAQSLLLTQKHRPDMFAAYSPSAEDKRLMEEYGEDEINDKYILGGK